MTERGLRGRPTLVQNVETLAHLALVGRHGADWFRELGTADEPGTMLVTISGAVVNPGVFEVAIGTPTSDVLELAGGPCAPIQALLIGGYFGTWKPSPTALSSPFSARGLGVGLGAGLVVALPAAGCGVLVDGAARPLSGVAIRWTMRALQIRAPRHCGSTGTPRRTQADAIRRLDAMGRRDRGSWSMRPSRRRCTPHPLGPRRVRSRGFGASRRALLGEGPPVVPSGSDRGGLVRSPLMMRIDRIACDGRGTCAELLPELIALDDWGYPILADGPVPGDLESLAHAAVELCPKMALQLRVGEEGVTAQG